MEQPHQALFNNFLEEVRRFFLESQSVDRIARMILTQVIQYLPMKDVRTCRLVSRRWREISQREWESRSLVIINSVPKMNLYIALFQNSLGSHTNFMLYSTCPLMEPTNRFLIIFGLHLKSLELRKCLWTGRNFPIILDSCPNLEKLVLVGRISSEDCIYPNVHYQDIEAIKLMAKKLYWPNLKILTVNLGVYAVWLRARQTALRLQPFIFQLLMASPNLETFNFYAPSEQFYSRMIYHLLFRPEIKLKKLANINLQPVREITTTELYNLQLRFPIAELSLDVDCIRVGATTLNATLASLGGTLKKLRIKYLHHERHPTARYFPCSRFLRNLRSLTLINFLGNVGFVVELTKLEYLYLDHTCPHMVFGGLEPGHVFAFPVNIRLAPLHNPRDMMDRAMFLIDRRD